MTEINFYEALSLVEEWEGLWIYTNDPEDPGGETFSGISRRYFPEWNGWKIVDEYFGSRRRPKKEHLVHFGDEKTKDNLRLLANKQYREQFWNRIQGHALENQKLANAVFQCAVNLGVHRAVRYLQRGLNIVGGRQRYTRLIEDGLVGPKTITEIQRKDEKELELIAMLVLQFQTQHYLNRYERTATAKKYIKGWLNRVRAFHC